MNQEKKQVESKEDAIARGKARLARLAELSKLAGASVADDKPSLISETKSLEAVLADMEAKNASQEQWKRDHAKERADFTQRLEDTDKRLASLTQADRRKVLDAAGQHHVSALPAPLEPIRNSGYSTPKPAPLPIDWAHWRLMPQVTLWEAVALSVNENPAVVNPFKADATFNNRMKVALSHVDAGSLPLVLHHPANQPVSRVGLSQFAAWAANLNLPDMPTELREMASTEPSAAPEQNTATPAPVGADDASDAVKPAENERPWLLVNPNDPEPKQKWYTPARYFARNLVIQDSTLLTKKLILANKVSASLKDVGILKRGGKKRLEDATVLKAFSKITWD